jgi:ABC-type transport system involved in cytochrome c biogenesis permease subunit
MPENVKNFIQNLPLFLKQQIENGNTEEIEKIVAGLKNFQQKYGENSLPSVKKVKAEMFYNHFPVPAILFFFNLLGGITGLIFIALNILSTTTKKRNFDKVFRAMLGFSLLLLSLFMALRIYISGRVPLVNSYETMLLLAWLILFLCFCLQGKFQLLSILGFLLSGLTLGMVVLVGWDPKITPLAPALDSPLLNLHVTTIIFSYALFTMMASVGVAAIVIYFTHRKIRVLQMYRQLSRLHTFSRSLLLPAVCFLGCGIIIGSVWANIAWGRYWAWDPKETSALVLFLLSMILLHQKLPKKLRQLLFFHIYTIITFGMVIFTYFGASFFFGGLHGYA